MKSKRKPACDLVYQSMDRRKAASWCDRLSVEDKTYLNEVMIEVRNCPEASIQAVARAIVKELNLNVSVETVRKTLREFLNA